MSNTIDPNVQFVIKKPICDGIGNVIKSYITGYSVYENTKIDCNKEFVFGDYSNVLEDKHIFDENNNLYPNRIVEYMYTSRLLVLSSEENEQLHIFMDENNEVNGCGNNKYNYLYSFKCLIDYNYDPSKVCEKVKNRIISTIDKIQFKPIIIENVLKNTQNINENTLGISVRTWKCFHESNINRPYHFETYKNQIIYVLENNKIENIIISFDNHDVEEEYIHFLSTYNIPIHILKKKENINELQNSMIKMLTLSKCKYFIGNRISTFSELIFWFSKCKIKCFNVF